MTKQTTTKANGTKGNHKAASKSQTNGKGGKAAKAAKASQNAAGKPQQQTNGNPYRVGGGYWASVEALRSLGVGKMHSHDKIVPAVKRAMGDGWKAFAAKGGKLSPEERVLTNVMVTARQDYGAPLIEAGWHVVWDGREKTAGLFKVGSK